MKRLTKRFKRALRRSQTGQAILLLAFGFIMLIGFVGLVTDLSMMFIRYTALRRAVDSAAVAAAGQFSRTVSDQENKQRTTYAARQFLEFHGIDPSGVVVDSCGTVPNAEGNNWNYSDAQIAAAPEDDPPENLDADPANDIPTQDTLSYRRDVFNDVCDPDIVGDMTSDLSGRKLVRVQATINIPTTFMALLGQESFELTASAVSETASLDVVIVLDVSESMLFDTTYDDYDRFLFKADTPDDLGRRWIRYLPPRMNNFGNSARDIFDNYRTAGGTKSFAEFQREFLRTYNLGGYLTDSRDYDGGYKGPIRWTTEEGIELNVGYGRYYMENDVPRLLSTGRMTTPSLQPGTGVTGSTVTPGGVEVYDMDVMCRVAIHPASWILTVSEDVPNLGRDNGGYGTNISLLEQYAELTGDTGSPWDTTGGQMAMFQPNFDFYGCCNDPTTGATIAPRTGEITVFEGNNQGERAAAYSQQDNDFADLVCQPFKQARDASQEFLYNIDFLAGDRVAFITFDRSAFPVDPDGDGPLSVMIEDRNIAETVLTQSIGVRAEPNFYHSDGTTGRNGVFMWTDYAANPRLEDTNGDGDGDTLTSDPLDKTNDYDLVSAGALTRSYLVNNSCAYYNAMLPGDEGGSGEDLGFSIWDQNGQDWGLLWDATFTAPYAYQDGDVEDQVEDIADPNFFGYHTYELWGNCRGTNFGAALREANNVLVDDRWTRRDGVVWVVVMLSDGAAGATDPIGVTDEPNPYRRDDGSTDGSTNYADPPDPKRGTYGAFGFCAYQTQIDDDNDGDMEEEPLEYSGFTVDASPPHCVDLDPNSRHACGTDIDGDVNNKLPLEIPLIANQDENMDMTSDGCRAYDPDDYARDWADFVAMSRGDQRQLPTIYTIGFNLEYNVDWETDDDPDTNNKCEANPQDCLGEELLRYIADIGDNNERNPNDYPNATEGDRFTEVNYGNYWNAPDGDELRDVFDEIASRLFIRLTG